MTHNIPGDCRTPRSGIQAVELRARRRLCDGVCLEHRVLRVARCNRRNRRSMHRSFARHKRTPVRERFRVVAPRCEGADPIRIRAAPAANPRECETAMRQGGRTCIRPGGRSALRTRVFQAVGILESDPGIGRAGVEESSLPVVFAGDEIGSAGMDTSTRLSPKSYSKWRTLPSGSVFGGSHRPATVERRAFHPAVEVPYFDPVPHLVVSEFGGLAGGVDPGAQATFGIRTSKQRCARLA